MNLPFQKKDNLNKSIVQEILNTKLYYILHVLFYGQFKVNKYRLFFNRHFAVLETFEVTKFIRLEKDTSL